MQSFPDALQQAGPRPPTEPATATAAAGAQTWVSVESVTWHHDARAWTRATANRQVREYHKEAKQQLQVRHEGFGGSVEA